MIIHVIIVVGKQQIYILYDSKLTHFIPTSRTLYSKLLRVVPPQNSLSWTRPNQKNRHHLGRLILTFLNENTTATSHMSLSTHFHIHIIFMRIMLPVRVLTAENTRIYRQQIFLLDTINSDGVHSGQLVLSISVRLSGQWWSIIHSCVGFHLTVMPTSIDICSDITFAHYISFERLVRWLEVFRSISLGFTESVQALIC